MLAVLAPQLVKKLRRKSNDPPQHEGQLRLLAAEGLCDARPSHICIYIYIYIYLYIWYSVATPPPPTPMVMGQTSTPPPVVVVLWWCRVGLGWLRIRVGCI